MTDPAASSVPGAATGPSAAFEELRREARIWVVREAYAGRKSDPDLFDPHETYVLAPVRSRVDDLTPLPLPSVLTTSPQERTTMLGRTAAAQRVACGAVVAASVTGAVLFDHALLDLAAVVPGLAAAACLTRFGRSVGFAGAGVPVASGEKLSLRSYEVVPEIAYAYRLIKAAPERLIALNADSETIAAVERAWETVLREVPRLPDEAFDQRFTRGKWITRNNQNATTAYNRIMDAGAEVLVMLRAAEEKEYALSPQGTTLGPWSRLTAEPVVADLLDQARMAQELTPRLR